MSWFTKYNLPENRNWLGAIYLKPLFNAFLGLLVSIVIFKVMIPESADLSTSTMLLISLLPIHVIAIGIFLYKLFPAVLQLGANVVLQWKTEEKKQWRNLCWSFLKIIMATIAINFLTTLVSAFFGIKMEEQDIVGRLLNSDDICFIIMTSFFAVFLAPITEELLFRLGVYNALTFYVPHLAATVITSLLFAAAHGQISTIPGLFVIGLFLQSAKKRYGLRQSMLLHAIYNAFQLAMLLMVHVFTSS
ncbi:MAG: CPBP family intramembrane metalloprotease [Victivallales bacterium]|nr:CPBP family intramembrane metalloprotease [Victivallales bacterium]